MAANADEVYKELSAEDVDELRPMEIESLCVNCEENVCLGYKIRQRMSESSIIKNCNFNIS